ncbi:MAG: tRNA-2-methylthio-N6-dimethylallyladenosine synthase [Glaciecola sp.]|jgi:tRNA-2-methylthio-N6-dimethylallyladenosine synthase
MSRTYLIRTFGCQMNEHDSGRAAGILETLGYRPVTEESEASLVLINTCAVRENADNKLYGTLGHLAETKRQHGTKIVVGGCLAQKDGATIVQKAPWVDVVFGTHNLANLPDLLAQADGQGLPVVEILEQIETFPSALPAKRDVRHHAWVSISVGCNNSCTFCIVPALRGPEVSRRIGDIVQECRALVDDDVVEVTLLGQNVNSYGRDLGGTSLFAELLTELGTVEGLERIRFTSPHPRDFTEDVLEAMAATPAVCEHLHLPLQSGSDRVLKSMRRSYRSKRFLDIVKRTRELIPGASLTTDIIVGFPGETEADFQATLELVEEVRFEGAFTFEYSPRPGTPAAEMVDDFVDPAVVNERYQRLEAVIRRHSLERHQELLGTQVEVLLETISKTDATRLSGRTRGNALVHLPAADPTAPPEQRYSPGDFVVTTIVEAKANYCLGDAPSAVRRTRAGRAAESAMAAGGTHRLHAAPAIVAPEGMRGDGPLSQRRSLPVLPS